MRIEPATLLLVLVLAAGVAHGGEDTQPSVTAPGHASIEVHPDRLVIEFELVTERATFAEAAQGAREMASALESLAPPAEPVSVAVEYDLTFMRQKSWGRGRKLEHRFRMTVANVPDGKAQAVMIYFVDRALEQNAKLTVESFQALLSDDRALESRKRLLARAVADATANANSLAEAAGMRLTAATMITVAGSSPLNLNPGVADYDSRFFQRFQEPFVVTGLFPSRIQQSIGVYVRFSVEQR